MYILSLLGQALSWRRHVGEATSPCVYIYRGPYMRWMTVSDQSRKVVQSGMTGRPLASLFHSLHWRIGGDGGGERDYTLSPRSFFACQFENSYGPELHPPWSIPGSAPALSLSSCLSPLSLPSSSVSLSPFSLLSLLSIFLSSPLSLLSLYLCSPCGSHFTSLDEVFRVDHAGILSKPLQLDKKRRKVTLRKNSWLALFPHIYRLLISP